MATPTVTRTSRTVPTQVPAPDETCTTPGATTSIGAQETAATTTVPTTTPVVRRTARPHDTSRRDRRSTTHRIVAGLLLVLAALVPGYPDSIVGSTLWWAMDSGPLARAPRDVLTEPSPAGAVRVFGDHPGTDPSTAARETVDALVDAGGLDRAVLSVDLPTGSGWIDPDQVEGLEQWAHGDIASVAVRYSAAPSAGVLLMHRDLAEASATALLKEVTDRVDALPADRRPQLVVHGQSLGALVGSDILDRDPGLADLVSAVLWQGMPGGADDPAPADRCTVSQLNADDPVGQLSTDLLRHPRQAVRVLTALPGSENSPVGTGHSYGAALPPAGCVTADRPGR